MCAQETAEDCGCEEVHPLARRKVAQVDGRCVETPTFYCPPSPGEGAAATPVGELALSGFTCLDPELGAVRAAAILSSEHACCAPVVDDRGALVGVVSAEALKRREAAADLEVEDAMAPAVVTVEPGATVAEVAAAMMRTGLERVPLVTRAGECVGVVTAMDLVRWLAGGGQLWPKP